MCPGGQRLFPVGHMHKHVGVVHVRLSGRIYRPPARKARTSLSRWERHTGTQFLKNEKEQFKKQRNNKDSDTTKK